MSRRKNVFSLRLKFILIILIVWLSVFPLASNSIPVMVQAQTNVIDGTIADGEYQFNATLGDGAFTLYWRTVADEIYVGMVGQTTGWIALGISPTFMMENADMIMGFVTAAGDTEVLDAYATGPTGPHPPDIDLGGTADITEYNGTEANELTTIEFKRQLATDDDYDKPFPSDTTIKIIWALGSSDDFEAQHVKRGSASFNLEGATTSFGVNFIPYLFLGFSLFIGLFGLLVFVDTTIRSRENQNKGGTV
ncbi:MAG: DOMON domain-containing protein [Candidatus Hermodarchaeota archaeon]